MKYILFTFLIVVSGMVKGQTEISTQNFKVETTREAQYPGGESELYRDIYINLNYSEEAKAQKVETTVMVSLFVEADSSVSNIKVLNDPGFGTGDSLKVYLNNTRFIPALMNGTPYRTQLMLNIPLRAH